MAGVHLALHGADPRWRGVLERRYRDFTCESPAPGLDLVLHAEGDAPQDVTGVQEMRGESVVTGWNGRSVSLATSRFRVEVDLAARRGDAWGPCYSFTVDSLVRLLLPLVLAPDGLVFHGALMVAGDSAWLCSGPSGSGKSTLARLLPEYARCDELAAVRCRDGRWEASSLPFWRSRPDTAPLSCLYLLRHGARDERRLLPRAEAVRRLTTEVRWPHEPSAAAQALRTFSALLQDVPVYELGFRPTPAVWEVLSAPSTAEAA